MHKNISTEGDHLLRKKIMFTSFIMAIVVIALSVFFSPTHPSVIILGGRATAAEHITLTWAGDPQTTQTITWKTEAADVTGQVQYAEEKQGRPFPANAAFAASSVEELATNWGSMNVHSVTLTGLIPNTSYIYRVQEGAEWSELHRFTTAPIHSSGFKFLVFGDSQSSNYNVWQTTLHKAYEANPEAVFFTNIGDLVDVGQDYAQWKSWFDGAQGVVDAIPVMPLTGNHEAYTPERRFSMPVLFKAQLKLPLNGPEELKGQTYSFDYGDVHFVMLDSQEGEERSFVPDMLERQKEWLENDLARTNKKWKIICIHRSPYNNKDNHNNNIKTAFVPILDKYHADVVFTGHDHVYARTYPLYNNGVVDSPAKGTIYVAAGRSGTKTYIDAIAKEWNEFFYNPVDEPNYLTVEIKADVLTVKAFKQKGTLIDEWQIDKKSEKL